jgi:site-specific recombinase XerD
MDDQGIRTARRNGVAPRHRLQTLRRPHPQSRSTTDPAARPAALRHAFLKASGADLQDIKDTLGHSTISITSDTYTSVIHELETERAKVEAAAALIPRTKRKAG